MSGVSEAFNLEAGGALWADGEAGRYRVIFLDAGGTLIHLDRAFILSALAEHGVPCDEAGFSAASRAAQSRVTQLLRSGAPGDDAHRARLYWAAFLRHAGCLDGTGEAVAAAIFRRHDEGLLWSCVEPGTRDALAELRRQGYILGVVSNSDGQVGDLLRRAGLAELLDLVVDSAVVGIEKPDARIFWLACQAAGAAPAEALHVGDIYDIDVVGARAAGLDALLVDPGDACGDVDCPRIPGVSHLPGWPGLQRAG